MEIGAAELAFDHRRALEIMADRQFLRDADAAMGLDSVLTHEIAAARDLCLCRRHRRHTLVRGQAELQRAHDRHRTRLFYLHPHVDHAVLVHRSAEHKYEIKSLMRIST